MNKAINVRGTNGSGKSFIIKSLLKDYPSKVVRAPSPPTDLFDAGGEIEGHRVDYKGKAIYIIGNYTVKTRVVGCDRIKTQAEICTLVRKYLKKGHVVFESIIVSTLFDRYINFSREVGGMIWVYLDTPLEICMKRIIDTRSGKGLVDLKSSGGRTSLLEDKYKNINRTRTKAKRAGEIIVDLRYKHSYEDFCRLLNRL